MALAAFVIAAPNVSIAGEPSEQSISFASGYRMRSLLGALATANSYGYVFEHLLQSTVFLLEESGGFSDVDAEKLSIYGDSWLWTQWSYEGFDLTDPFFDGAAAVRVPFAHLSELALFYAQMPERAGASGPALFGPRAPLPARAWVSVHAPNAGGIAPFAKELTGTFSGRHARDRRLPPPLVRRRLTDAFALGIQGSQLWGELAANYTVEVKRGGRQFLRNVAVEPYFLGTDEERFVLASAAVDLRPEVGRWTAHVLAEHRARDRLYAEQNFGANEVARHDRTALFAGVSWPSVRAGVLLQRFSIQATSPGFTRDLHDPDGEALFPFYPSGNYTAGRVELAAGPRPLYLRLREDFLHFSPTARQQTHRLTYDRAPNGRVELSTASTFQLLGEHRAGAADELVAGDLRFAYDLYFSAAHAAVGSFDRALWLWDAGVSTRVAYTAWPSFSPFLMVAKTPVAPTSDLARAIDPRYQNTATYLGSGSASRLIDTSGGAHTTIAPGLVPTNVWSGALGFSTQLSEHFSLIAQGIAKAYPGTYRFAFEGGPENNGRFVDGIYFLADGPKKYVLENSTNTPVYFGFHLQLLGIDTESFVVNVAFSAFNAIGRPPFGSGVTANDIGVVHASSANPNSDRLGLASVDADRAFLVKALFGWRVVESVWAFLAVRHRDGQPFAFLDAHEDEGQIALAYHSNRGSPLKYDRPLAGPREDFHLGVDLSVKHTRRIQDLELEVSVLCANLFDLGNEIAELNAEPGVDGRSALETQIPRSLWFQLALSY